MNSDLTFVALLFLLMNKNCIDTTQSLLLLTLLSYGNGLNGCCNNQNNFTTN